MTLTETLMYTFKGAIGTLLTEWKVNEHSAETFNPQTLLNLLLKTSIKIVEYGNRKENSKDPHVGYAATTLGLLLYVYVEIQFLD